MRAEAAAEPLLALLRHIDEDDDDWAGEELPDVFGLIGPPAVPALAGYLHNPANLTFARVAAGEGLRRIGAAHPGAREACVQALVAALELPVPVDETVNGFVTSGLIALKAVEAAPALERAFAAERIDETIAGDWEEVQIALGLKAERETEAEERPIPEAIRAWNEALRAKKRAAEQAKAARREKKKRKRGRGKKRAA